MGNTLAIWNLGYFAVKYSFGVTSQPAVMCILLCNQPLCTELLSLFKLGYVRILCYIPYFYLGDIVAIKTLCVCQSLCLVTKENNVQ